MLTVEYGPRESYVKSIKALSLSPLNNFSRPEPTRTFHSTASLLPRVLEVQLACSRMLFIYCYECDPQRVTHKNKTKMPENGVFETQQK